MDQASSAPQPSSNLIDQDSSAPQPFNLANAPEGAPGKLEPIDAAILWTRRIVCFSLVLVGVCVIWVLGGRLWRDLAGLTSELAGARNREPMGYLGISSEHPEFKPPSCIQEKNGRIYLWAGSGVEGQSGWFDVSGTDLPLKQFRYAFGRDKIRTIDYPILQPPDGEIARRIYPERPVLGVVVRDEARAYPVTVMEKVEVVNDTVAGVPLVIAYLPLLERPLIFERTLDGSALSFGTSGYIYNDAFVLYDRGTDSLWYPMEQGLTAITGPLAGTVMKPPAELIEKLPWGKWLRRYPATRIVVGADRSRGIPFNPADAVAVRSL